ncbi:MAG: hypothetical protein PHN75_14840 [Syntrophales bacterium]|nr:hypothetical protein [Syntrophales bacterium]
MLGLKKYVLFLPCLIVPLMTSQACGAPTVVIEEMVYDAGEIPQGKKVVHDFPVRNAGNEALIIKVKPC